MKEEDILNDMISRYPALEDCKYDILEACKAVINCYSNHGKLLLCGNGGSCSDAEHIVGELMKSFERKRPIDKTLEGSLKSVSGERGAFIADRLQNALPAISLNAHSALYSAISNDMDANLVFAQQIAGYGQKNDSKTHLFDFTRSRRCQKFSLIRPTFFHSVALTLAYSFIQILSILLTEI